MVDRDTLESMRVMMREEMEPKRADIRTLKDDMQTMKSDMQTMKSDMQFMKDDMQFMKSDVQFMKDDMQFMKSDVQTMKDDIQSLKADVSQMPAMRRDINLILESQQGINDKFKKLDQVAEDVEEIKIKVTALEAVTKDNTSQIRELKIAK